MAEDDPRHGTLDGYTNWMCRCEECREAWAVNRRIQSGGSGPKNSKPLHGTRPSGNNRTPGGESNDWKFVEAGDNPLHED